MINNETDLLIDLDDDITAMLSKIKPPRNKLTEPLVLEIRQALKDGASQPEIAKKYNVTTSTISSININKIWREVQLPENETTAFMHTMYPEPEPDLADVVDFKEIDSNDYDGNRQQVGLFDLFQNTGVMLYEVVLHEETPAIIGQDIINIRALSGKKRKEADEALRAATVEFLKNAPEKCIYIPGNVASSKNSKEIGMYFKKNPKTGVNDRIPTLIDSKVTQKYKRETAGHWLKNKVHFLNLTRHMPKPLHIEFTFIRDSLRAFDYINACQVLADLMKDNGYFHDDDTVHFLPVFNPVVYYHNKMAGVLIRVID